MLPQDVWLRTEWLSCRRNSVLRCVERYSAAAASEYRRALRKVQEVEETMAQVGTETGPHGTASQPAARLQSGEVEALNRRLSAANAEIRRYQTRLFACEREVGRMRNWKHSAIRRAKMSCCRPRRLSPRCWTSPACR